MKTSKYNLILGLFFLCISTYAHAKVNLKNSVQTQKNIYTYLGGGASSFKLSQKGSDFTVDALNTKSTIFEIGVGKNISNEFSIELVLQRSILDIANIDTFYTSINYQFRDGSIRPFLGLLLGGSQLKWSDNPHIILYNQNLKSTGITYGGEFGLKFDLDEAWGIVSKYQLMKYNLSLSVLNGSKTLAHKYAQNIIIGVQYEF